MRYRDRDLKRIARAPFQGRHWLALWRMIRIFERPVAAFARYISNDGHYPYTFVLRTPIGPLRLSLRDYHDLLTVNEIFCRQDYGNGRDVRTVVDIGANRGLAALFFLSRHPDCRVYCFEPDPKNTAALRETLAGFESRYVLVEKAVTATSVTTIRFVPSGRYGHTAGEQDEGETVVEFPAISIGDAMRMTLEGEPRIDLVKIDTEGSEPELVAALQRDAALGAVRQVVFEDNRGMTRWMRFDRG